MPLQKIKERLLELQACCDEEGLKPVSKESESLFLDFLEFMEGFGCLESKPDITLTPDYEVYVTWRCREFFSGKEKKFFFRFMADKTIRFGVMNEDPHRTIR